MLKKMKGYQNMDGFLKVFVVQIIICIKTSILTK